MLNGAAMPEPKYSWAFLTRAGAERDVIEELGPGHGGEAIAEGVVVAQGRPRGSDGRPVELAFARQAARLVAGVVPLHPEQIADALVRGYSAGRAPRGGAWRLQLVAPDSTDPRDPRRRQVEALTGEVLEAVRARLPEADRGREVQNPADADRLLQAWVLDEASVVCGVTPVGEALSSAPAGKVRLRRPDDAPSRAGLKLEEAIVWVGLGPEKGDTAVDLGASPGGWSQVAVGRGASVVAIDPAPLKIALPPRRLAYVQASAFDYAPEETIDWLLCDMAWRPLEVAALIAKWGRRVWARQLIANFKLPMKRKVDMVRRVLEILESAGWRGLRVRQLYHDRDEVTVFGWLDPNTARRGLQAPFELRSRRKRAADGERAAPAGHLRARQAQRPGAEARTRGERSARGRGPARPAGRARSSGRVAGGRGRAAGRAGGRGRGATARAPRRGPRGGR